MRGFIMRWGGPGAVLGAVLALVGCNHLGRGGGGCDPDGCPPGVDCHTHLKVEKHPTVMALAHDLDHLERHIDWFGSATAKVPDVWGQARLTRYREDFERLMDPTDPANKLDFKLGLQGSLARSDQAFFAQATALSFAAQPRGGGGPPPVLVPQTRETTVVSETVAKQDRSQDATTKSGDSSVTNKNSGGGQGTDRSETKTTEGVAKKPDPVKPIELGDPASLLTKPDEAIKRELVAERLGFGGNLVNNTIGIEPTLMVAQKKRYLDFLNQLRRENEGDDSADSPGYSLNLVRVPVSVLPGKKTDVGHGAEVTMTLAPVLGDDLLPMTFRNLVTNDLLHQLGFPLTQLLDDRDPDNKRTANREFSDLRRQFVIGLPVFNELNKRIRDGADDLQITEFLRGRPPEDLDRLDVIAGFLDQADKVKLEGFVAVARKGIAAIQAVAPSSGSESEAAILNRRRTALKTVDEFKGDKNPYKPYVDSAKQRGADLREQLDRQNRRLALKLSGQSLPVTFSPRLENKTGFPTSQLTDVYGLTDCFQIAYTANIALKDSIDRQGYAHLPDIQGFLQQEALAAYRFLAEPECASLWTSFCTPELVSAVRTRKVGQLQDYREQYRKAVEAITLSTPEFRDKRPYNDPGQYSTTAALAWCILVDSALLTDKLVRDMGEVATSKGAALPHCGVWLPYFLPNPPPEARQAFNEYVKLRWPVHVFALDPYTEDQNVADRLSTRREIQLALALAFTSGQMSARSLTKFTRRLEAEYESIQLNRTQVGFSHGENVFGWRFYPRFQSPDTEGNLTVLGRDLFVGGPDRNALLRQRRLEPGPRECVAVVMMPAFVPYATLDVTTNWFALANPKHKSLDHTQAMRLSRTVQGLKTGGPAVGDAACYRDGEFRRLMNRVDQLEARLPTQTITLPVPVLNTLGGFEMFSNGTTDLAPELYGWYGAPGVSATTDTTLFLVGDHFSPLRTRVIVGNQEITVDADPAKNRQRMLSRQVVQVTVPAGVLTVPDPDTGVRYAHAHIATPYGVTRELRIPVPDAAPAKPAPAEGFKLNDTALTVRYQSVADREVPGRFRPEFRNVAEDGLGLTWADASGSVLGNVTVRFNFTFQGKPLSVAVRAASQGPTFTIGPKELGDIGRQLIEQINDQAGTLTASPNPLAEPLTSTSVTVQPVADPSHAVRSVPVSPPLVVTFAELPRSAPVITPPEPKKEDEKKDPKEDKDKKAGAVPPVAPPIGLPLPAAIPPQ